MQKCILPPDSPGGRSFARLRLPEYVSKLPQGLLIKPFRKPVRAGLYQECRQ